MTRSLLAYARAHKLTVSDMLGETMAVKSAENLRKLSRWGMTIRMTAEVIIAT